MKNELYDHAGQQSLLNLADERAEFWFRFALAACAALIVAIATIVVMMVNWPG